MDRVNVDKAGLALGVLGSFMLGLVASFIYGFAFAFIVLPIYDFLGVFMKESDAMPGCCIRGRHDAAHPLHRRRSCGEGGGPVQPPDGGVRGHDRFRRAGGSPLFAPGKFDVLITDVKMPGISGIEVLRRVRSADPDIPALVITAFGHMETAVEAMKEGVCYFLGKPFDRGHLLVAIEEILGRRCLVDEAGDLRVPRSEIDRGIGVSFRREGGRCGCGPWMASGKAGHPSKGRKGTENARRDRRTVGLPGATYGRRAVFSVVCPTSGDVQHPWGPWVPEGRVDR